MIGQRKQISIPLVALIVALTTLCIGPCLAYAQSLEIPRRHDRPPGPPTSAEEAVAKMTVPEGFSVEIVAAEPDVVNPVAMFIDEKGRFWITESFEYPRKEPGPGKDRIKVLEDTDGDGKVDKVTIFAEGLNIPSGIAVGHGGVWVANSPDILFMQDTDGDLKADKTEVIVTGFGRTDTHELPNSFTWGPDGWLYGLNGVFNYCDVKYGEQNPNYKPDHPGWKFTCAMFRIHPRTREFQIFAEGTSNPWGIAINDEGDFFISACVIDHLWHIVETGYYIRQGGPYPPHTWPMRSIVDHQHQLAAYCGITWFDSDAYPEEYRKVLYMGNIHGGCINADIIERSGSTYKGKPHPGFPAKPGAWDNDEYDKIAKAGDPADPRLADFLTANDPWFMPVVQKTGPDGCLYILDWYDRYHCYQDANADPAGIERARGRLYRVVYKGHKNQKAEDLSAKSDADLLQLLNGGNEYVRETARRLLSERLTPQSRETIMLNKLVLDETVPVNLRLRYLWTLSGIEGALNDDLLTNLAKSQQPQISSWAIRLAGDAERLLPGIAEDLVIELFGSGDLHSGQALSGMDPRILLQLAILTSKYSGDDLFVPRAYRQLVMLLSVQSTSGDDGLLNHVIWQNVSPVLQRPGDSKLLATALDIMEKSGQRVSPPWLDRATEILLSNESTSAEEYGIIARAAENPDDSTRSRSQAVLLSIIARAQAYDQADSRMQVLRHAYAERIRNSIRAEVSDPLYDSYLALGALFGMEEAKAVLREHFANGSDEARRIKAIRALVSANDSEAGSLLFSAMQELDISSGLRTSLIELTSQLRGVYVAEEMLRHFSDFESEQKPKAIEVLTQRPEWSKPLLAAIAAKEIDKDALNLNQLRRVASFKDAELQKQFVAIYGTLREGRNPNRERVVGRMRDFLNGTPGDPHQGVAVFKKVCAQCHKIYGEGAEVGPEITRNGRNNWEQLLQNVFDPSAVIGPGYQARIIATTDGRVLTGLPVEDSEQRVVLKIQGGKLETIPRDQIDEFKVSELSMMPEELEKQITPQELADLMAYLALDKPPTDPTATILSGAPKQKQR